MKVAITVWQQRVSPVFDVSGSVLLIHIQDGQVLSERLYPLTATDPMEKLAFINSLQAQVLICGAMSAEVQQTAESYPWQLYVFMKGGVRRMMRALIDDGVLADDFILPGCAGRGRRCENRMSQQTLDPCKEVTGNRRQLCQSEKGEG